MIKLDLIVFTLFDLVKSLNNRHTYFCLSLFRKHLNIHPASMNLYAEHINSSSFFPKSSGEELMIVISDLLQKGWIAKANTQISSHICSLHPYWPVRIISNFANNQKTIIEAKNIFYSFYEEVSTQLLNQYMFVNDVEEQLEILAICKIEESNIKHALHLGLENNESVLSLYLTLDLVWERMELHFLRHQYIQMILSKFSERNYRKNVKDWKEEARALEEINWELGNMITIPKIPESTAGNKNQRPNKKYRRKFFSKRANKFIRQLGSVFEKNSASYDKFHRHLSSLDAFQQEKNSLGEMISIKNIGKLFFDTGHYPEAKFCLLKSLEIYQDSLPVSIELGNIHINLGNVYFEMGDFAESGRAYKESLEIFHSFDEPLSMAQARQGLGIVYSSQGFFQESLKQYKIALEEILGFKHQRHYLIARVMHNIGNDHVALKEYEDAIIYFNRVLTIYQKSNNLAGSAQIFRELSGAHFFSLNFEESQKYILKSLNLFHELGFREEWEEGKKHLGVILLKKGFESSRMDDFIHKGNFENFSLWIQELKSFT